MFVQPYRYNPLIANDLLLADVEAHVFDGVLYLYGTYSGSLRNRPECPSFHVYSTEDFLHYTDHGVAFSAGDIRWADAKHLWAPDCVYANGKYYLYYCLNTGECGVAVSANPYGPFTDLGKIEGVAGIDPAVLVDDDGQAYLYYGQVDRVSVVKLKENMCEIVPGSRVQPLSVKEHEYHEGISVRKIDGRYYLVYTDTHRHCGMPTAQGYAVSDRPTEGFVYKNIIVDNFGCDGHTWNDHGSIEQYKGQWYIFYHRAIAGRNSPRQLCAEPIAIDENGNIREVEMTSSGTGGTISAAEPIPGCLACLVSGHARIDYDETSRYDLALCGIQGQDAATFRYIEFHGESHMAVTMRSAENCRVEMYVDGAYHESVRVKASGSYHRVETAMPALQGVHSITLKFYGIDTYLECVPLTDGSVEELSFF